MTGQHCADTAKSTRDELDKPSVTGRLCAFRQATYGLCGARCGHCGSLLVLEDILDCIGRTLRSGRNTHERLLCLSTEMNVGEVD